MFNDQHLSLLLSVTQAVFVRASIGESNYKTCMCRSVSYKQNRCIVNEHMRNIKPCFVNVNNTAFTEDCILNVILTVVSHIIFYFVTLNL